MHIAARKSPKGLFLFILEARGVEYYLLCVLRLEEMQKLGIIKVNNT
jgi:hypothetical protein